MQKNDIPSDHEIGAISTLLLALVIGSCIFASYIIKQNSLYYFPESGAAIFVGFIVGFFYRISKFELSFMTFEPELFFFILLPPIIFEAGYSLKKRDFFSNIWTISLFAVFGTVISTFIIGFLVYAIGLAGLVDIDTSSPMEALLFGALISAVDPVATLSIMGNPEIHCDRLLYSLVFGESVLNDAIAIVLFKTFMSIYQSNNGFTGLTILWALSSFTLTSLGSLCIGVSTGLICSFLFKHTQLRSYPEYEIILLFIFSYGSYGFAEFLELSGIMSLFFSSIVLSHYNSHNLSTSSQVTVKYIFKSLAAVSEFFVYLYIGIVVTSGQLQRWHALFSMLVLLVCVLARGCHAFPLSLLANCFRSTPIPANMQTAIWFSGLRGAISFSLAFNMPGPHRDLYVCCTLVVVVSSTLLCGSLTEPVLGVLGMKNSVPSERLPPHSAPSLAWLRMDGTYMAPLFGGPNSEYRLSEMEDMPLEDLLPLGDGYSPPEAL